MVSKEKARYDKKIQDQDKEEKKLRKRIAELEEGLREITSITDALMAAVTIYYGNEERGEGGILGYSMNLPIQLVKKAPTTYELTAQKNEENQVYIYKVSLRAEETD